MTCDLSKKGAIMTIRSLELMIDIDEPLFPWAYSVHEGCRAAGLHDLPEWSTWHMWEDYGCDQDLWLDVVARLTADGMYLSTPPVPGAAEALRLLRWEGHKIHLVTARGFNAFASEIRDWTKRWLDDFAIPYDTLTFATDKVKAMEELGVVFDSAIDDGIHNYEALNAAGVKVQLLDQPHNRSFTEIMGKSGFFKLEVRRVYSMTDYARLVQVAARGR